MHKKKKQPVTMNGRGIAPCFSMDCRYAYPFLFPPLDSQNGESFSSALGMARDILNESHCAKVGQEVGESGVCLARPQSISTT